MNYYVYYKVEPGRADSLRPAVEALFGKVEQEFRVRGRWMRRCDDAATFMEVYEGIADGQAFEAFLEREAALPGIARKLERFESA